MAASAKKVITVFGSTGAQGGSVAKALAARGTFAIRACTRNTGSARADALREAGCEVVQASYSDEASIRAAVDGAHGVFFITTTWGEGGDSAERAAGETIASACKDAGVQHVVFSTLEPPSSFGFEGGFLPFDNKAGVEQALLYAGVPFTFVNVAWYMTNVEAKPAFAHSGFLPPVKQDDGSFVLSFPIPECGLHAIVSTDVGECIAAVFERRDDFVGRKIGLSAELLTGEAVEQAFQEAFPEVSIRFEPVSTADFAEKCESSGLGAAVATMFKWYEHRMPHGCDIELTRSLFPGAMTFKEYVATHKDRWDFA